MQTDEQLYEDLRRGRRRAFDELYARYERKLFGFALAYVKNEQDAEEIFHDAFKALIDAGELPQKVGPWLFTVVRNASLNRMRGRRPVAGVVEELAAAAESAPDAMMRGERDHALAAAVERLPKALGLVYDLRRGGASYETMAQRLEVPVGTIKSRVNALVRRLKKDMAPWLT